MSPHTWRASAGALPTRVRHAPRHGAGRGAPHWVTGMSILRGLRRGRAALLGRGFDQEALARQILRKGDQGAFVPSLPTRVILLCRRAYHRSSPRRAVPEAAGGGMTAEAAARPTGLLPAR